MNPPPPPPIRTNTKTNNINLNINVLIKLSKALRSNPSRFHNLSSTFKVFNCLLFCSSHGLLNLNQEYKPIYSRFHEMETSNVFPWDWLCLLGLSCSSLIFLYCSLYKDIVQDSICTMQAFCLTSLFCSTCTVHF